MKSETETMRPKLAAPWIYFLATFAWTWLFWGVAILLGASVETPTGGMLMLAGVSGPTITGILFASLTKDKSGRQDYWKRVADVRRIAWPWYLVIFLFVPALNLVAALLDLAAGGPGPAWGEAALNALTDPFSIVLSILFVTLIPFLEELGWRGYVLDRLQEKNSALASSMILGVLWALWHLPLFFVGGTYQAGLGFGTPAFWQFMAGIVPLGVAFTWIYNNTKRSTLAVILFHAMVNFAGEIILLSARAETVSIALWFVAALGISVIWGTKTLRRQEGS